MQAGKEGYFKTAQCRPTCWVRMIWSGRHVVAVSIVTCQVQWNCCGVPPANCMTSFQKALLMRITIEKLQKEKKVCLLAWGGFCLFQNSVCISVYLVTVSANESNCTLFGFSFLFLLTLVLVNQSRWLLEQSPKCSSEPFAVPLWSS